MLCLSELCLSHLGQQVALGERVQDHCVTSNQRSGEHGAGLDGDSLLQVGEQLLLQELELARFGLGVEAEIGALSVVGTLVNVEIEEVNS